ncbi:MAG: acid phosphatase AphA [Candidatus Aminicenantes bacterium]|nr:acid phosphatase AphA [Candidatus Aminicenantes bacterium]
MLKKSAFRTISLIILVCILWVSCGEIVQYDGIRWVTLKEIEASLRNEPPMNVGFDIDDTVLFSSPGFYYGQQKYSPGNRVFLTMTAFWKEMNNGFDRFSIPKECAYSLIELHKKRGDSIFFITARIPSDTETVTELLTKIFELENPNEVIFTGFDPIQNLKIQPIKDNKIRIFYGDSGGDIEAAQAAGARAIRILRPGNSTNKPIPKAGGLGEEVLVDSEY